ncbi:LSM domain-containing protein [Xylogone sp. PMI_703]|nr:LSM domain-containing protein [Xylogone sp. PMI_703]
MEKVHAEDYLTSLLNKNLRVTTTDSRMFLGQFKCTDTDLNVILSHTFEYRMPPPNKASKLLEQGNDKVVIDMTNRYMGLVVVPGEHIVKIELEEFESQVAARNNASRSTD